MSWCVYIVKCGDGSYYTGATNNYEKRLKKHQEGKGAKYTRARLPIQHLWTRECLSKEAALRIEYAIKHLSRGQKELLAYDVIKLEECIDLRRVLRELYQD